MFGKFLRPKWTQASTDLPPPQKKHPEAKKKTPESNPYFKGQMQNHLEPHSTVKRRECEVNDGQRSFQMTAHLLSVTGNPDKSLLAILIKINSSASLLTIDPERVRVVVVGEGCGRCEMDIHFRSLLSEKKEINGWQ